MNRNLEKQTQAVAIDPADILTPDECAARLKVKKSWLYEKMRRGNGLPHFKLGRYTRYSWIAVSAWLRSVHVDAPRSNK
jgi:predicted DNA-binding transcriptional regulator AlpA